MYRLVLYSLLFLVFQSFIFASIKLINQNPIDLIVSLILLVAVCFIVNLILSKLFRTITNVESFLITSLILFLIVEPSVSVQGIMAIVLSGVIAMASKYILAISHRHIFNPAAVSAVILGLLGIGAVSWWVATPVLIPTTLAVGLLIIRKIRRFQLFLSFIFFAFITIFLFNISFANSPINLVYEIFSSWPILFFAVFMLTEPLTTPPRQSLRIIYGCLVGVLFGMQFHIGPIYSTPELALVLGNVFSYLVGSKDKFKLVLAEKKELVPNIYNFAFNTDRKPVFVPGQYLEWTIKQDKIDSRGNRRYFTIASSPTENQVHLGIRYSKNPSSFKNSLLSLKNGESLSASSLSGDFVLPENLNQKMVFIAGGIGITPFRSMVKFLIDKNQRRDIVLFYANSSQQEFIYKEVFDEAEKKLGIKVYYVVTKAANASKDFKGITGYLTEGVIRDRVSDYGERKFYLSGPQAMVDSYKKVLSSLGVKKQMIVTDYFPGF